MEFVDTHCHIQSAGGVTIGDGATRQLWAKAPDLTADEIIASATQAGVTRLLCVGCDPDDSKLAVDFVKNRENTWATAGIHPHEASHFVNNEAKLADFRELVANSAANKVVAIGEAGFDLYYNHSNKADQEAILRFQLELAVTHHLPLVFHVRDAFEDFWRVLKNYPGITGVVHSFSAGKKELEQILERGLYVGLNGIQTFTKLADQQAAARAVPLDKMLLETDAPFLTPAPYRGKVNEPKYVRVTAEFLSEVRGESLEQIAEATTNNAWELFHL